MKRKTVFQPHPFLFFSIISRTTPFPEAMLQGGGNFLSTMIISTGIGFLVRVLLCSFPFPLFDFFVSGLLFRLLHSFHLYFPLVILPRC